MEFYLVYFIFIPICKNYWSDIMGVKVPLLQHEVAHTLRHPPESDCDFVIM